MIRPIARALAPALACVAILATSPALCDEAPIASRPKYTENDRLDDIVRQFIEEYVVWSPTQATYLGIHDRDAVLEDRARLAIDNWEKELNSYRRALQTVIETKLDAEHLTDLTAFRHLVQRELFE